MKKNYSILLPFLFLIFLWWFNACRIEDTLSSEETNSQIYSAANYKSRECGNPIPQPFLFALKNNVSRRNVDLCTFAIIRMDCPFDGYPIVCILIYLDELGEIPNYLDFEDFINVKL